LGSSAELEVHGLAMQPPRKRRRHPASNAK
jgi:hypothetical protein